MCWPQSHQNSVGMEDHNACTLINFVHIFQNDREQTFPENRGGSSMYKACMDIDAMLMGSKHM